MTGFSSRKFPARFRAACSRAHSWAETLLRQTYYQVLEERRLQNILAAYRGKHVLDVGCGLGKYLNILEAAGCRATGVDINPVQVDALRDAGKRVFTPDALPDGERYDLILMAHVIEHMDTTALVAFMNRYLPLLHDDGKCIIVTPVPGDRFWHDFTHVRPYLPQSIRMMFGGIVTPSSTRTRHGMMLEDVHFFKDSWRLRNFRAFYPFSASRLFRHGLRLCNIFLALLHLVSGGRLGTTASWLGVYAKNEQASE